LAPASSGFETVAASENPLARIFVGSSFGREIVTRRAATEAMSSRTTSMPCAGIVSRRLLIKAGVHSSAQI